MNGSHTQNDEPDESDRVSPSLALGPNVVWTASGDLFSVVGTIIKAANAWFPGLPGVQIEKSEHASMPGHYQVWVDYRRVFPDREYPGFFWRYQVWTERYWPHYN